MTVQTIGATSAPSPKSLQTARIVAAGESPAMAIALAIIAYPIDRRDDLALLDELTRSRIASYAEAR